jgi:acetyl-CoA carboxylase biotin carboxyl carrier protein
MSEFKIDEAAIRKLAALLKDTDLAEIEVKEGERYIRVGRGGGAAVAAYAPAPVGAPMAMPAGDGSKSAEVISGTQVTSPMVGTVYLSSSPGGTPFVKVGDTVKEGDTLLIVEAMKVMNPIKAPRAGAITRVPVADAQPVEFGETLMVIG